MGKASCCGETFQQTQRSWPELTGRWTEFKTGLYWKESVIVDIPKLCLFTGKSKWTCGLLAHMFMLAHMLVFLLSLTSYISTAQWLHLLWNKSAPMLSSTSQNYYRCLLLTLPLTGESSVRGWKRLEIRSKVPLASGKCSRSPLHCVEILSISLMKSNSKQIKACGSHRKCATKQTVRIL